MIAGLKYSNVKSSFSRWQKILLVVSVYLFFTSFYTIPKNSTNTSNQIIIDWYNYYLDLERSDITAYPPVSGQRLSKLGIAGYLTYQMLMENNQKNETLFFMVYNEVFAHLLKEMYHGKVKNSYQQIEDKKLNIQGKVFLTAAEQNKVKQYTETVLEYMTALEKNLTKNEPGKYHDQKVKLELQYNNKEQILPEWGENPTWVIDKADFFLPPPYHESGIIDENIKKDALSVYSIGSNLSKENKWIAEFWSDDVRGLTFSPLSRWFAITNQILESENPELSKLVDIYLKLGIGMNDAAVMTWFYKYHYNLLRPSDYISKNLDSSWKPFHSDPKFPSYPSGHAVFGAVASTILEDSFGSSYSFTDASHSNRSEFLGKRRSFPSLAAMAKECAWSRIVMGVHFYEDCNAGLNYGKQIGKYINENGISRFHLKTNCVL